MAKLYEKLEQKPEATAYAAMAMKIRNPEKMQKPRSN